MNCQKRFNDSFFYFICFVTLLFFTLTPIWLSLILLSILLFFIRPNSRLCFLLCALSAILSAIMISSINISGDVENYKDIYTNINLSQYTDEFKYEPFLIIFYKFMHLFNASFDNVLFTQALIMNFCLLFAMIKTFGLKGINYYSLVLIYPQYIQLSLFLSRQSWAVVFLLIVLSLISENNKNIIKKLFFSALSISSHLISVFYLLLQVVAKVYNRFLGWKTFFTLWLLALFLPATIELMQHTFVGLFSYSDIIDRKIGFYLNSSVDETSSSMGLLSLSVIPLHLICIMNFLKIYHEKSIAQKNLVIVFFITIYMAVLFTINYPLLPGRIGLVILMFTPYFYFYTTQYIYSNSKKRTLLAYAGLALFILMYIRFLYTNDFGDYNVKLADGNLLSLSILGFL
ncbi:hypothetical protein D4N07_00710 [Enterobacter hormaechei]|uniref:EpsG family protein n=1 Tax=Enterobacter hormaechei TaxID=158836 RepID=UPI0011DDE412|nr:EpsG family protein [Enterobacter hormaechei]TXU08304.1 hypothetical protein D4N07_00710 [Enterobacter hormaechei]